MSNDKQEFDQDNGDHNETYSVENRNLEDIALSMLSPWERWRLKKKFEEEKQKELKIAKEKVEISAKEKKEMDKMEKEMKINEELKKWVQRKHLESIKNQTEKQKKEEMDKMNKAKQKEHMKKLRQGKYNQWWEKLKQEERLKKEREDKVKSKLWCWKSDQISRQRFKLKANKEKEEERQRKKEKSEKAYDKWCEKLKSRPKTMFNSFIIANGKCLKYYDWSSNPEPTFVNPIPWTPLEIKNDSMKPLEKTKRSKSAQNF